MTHYKSLLCGAALCALIAPAQSAVVALPADGNWASFTVDDQLSVANDVSWIDLDGSPLSFSFTIPQGSIGTLTVVDSVFAGDHFTVTDGGSLLGETSAVPLGTLDLGAAPVFDFDAALSNPAFSRGVFTLSAGSYLITGTLSQSVMIDATTPLNATEGAVKLNVTAVPAPAALVSLITGLTTLGFSTRRRKA